MTLVRSFGWDRSGFWEWSTGERLVVALVVDAVMGGRTSWGAVTDARDAPEAVLPEQGWSRDDAINRWAGERFCGDLDRCEVWIESLAARVRAGVAA
ncbi:hypothetical protein [Gordonia sputi]|uniref:hypothetical protein n=1 Tax=Gordonia sputi TaxID=36823 RepID=UPI0036AE69A0